MKRKGLIAAAALGFLVAAGSTYAQQDTTSQTRTETQTTETKSESSNDVVSINGTVSSYEAGHSITIQKPDGTTVTYTINQQSMVPTKLETGKTVTVRTTKVSGSPVVQRVTYTTKTTTTTK